MAISRNEFLDLYRPMILSDELTACAKGDWSKESMKKLRESLRDEGVLEEFWATDEDLGAFARAVIGRALIGF